MVKSEFNAKAAKGWKGSDWFIATKVASHRDCGDVAYGSAHAGSGFCALVCEFAI